MQYEDKLHVSREFAKCNPFSIKYNSNHKTDGSLVDYVYAFADTKCTPTKGNVKTNKTTIRPSKAKTLVTISSRFAAFEFQPRRFYRFVIIAADGFSVFEQLQCIKLVMEIGQGTIKSEISFKLDSQILKICQR